jgi:hypothetical protein
MSDSPVTQSEMKAALESLENRLVAHTNATRLELKSEMQSLETRLLDPTERVRIEVLERTEKVETTLLKEFRKWGISFESRFKANDALVYGFNERLISVEERVTNLESR